MQRECQLDHPGSFVGESPGIPLTPDRTAHHSQSCASLSLSISLSYVSVEKKELDAFSIGVGANGAGVVVEYAYAGCLVEIAGAQIRRRDRAGVTPSNFDGILGSGCERERVGECLGGVEQGFFIREKMIVLLAAARSGLAGRQSGLSRKSRILVASW
jgi:hypothetical protein